MNTANVAIRSAFEIANVAIPATEPIAQTIDKAHIGTMPYPMWAKHCVHVPMPRTIRSLWQKGHWINSFFCSIKHPVLTWLRSAAGLFKPVRLPLLLRLRSGGFGTSRTGCSWSYTDVWSAATETFKTRFWAFAGVWSLSCQPSPTPYFYETNQHSQILPDPLNVTVSLMDLDCLRPELRRNQVSRKLTSITWYGFDTHDNFFSVECWLKYGIL